MTSIEMHLKGWKNSSKNYNILIMKEFNNALSNFINDVAGGGAIRHLADLGYSISDIKEELSYPMPKEKIAEIMWEHFINIGKISFDKPSETHEKISYVKEQDSYGRVTFRRVVEEIDNSDREYVLCDFGAGKDDEDYLRWLSDMEPSDREYIELMPWPKEPIYHELDDRIRRINSHEK
ncbi:MAG: hypothetical protein K5865_00165 [Eubacterium sp.]|nr:hypothetical protein [Eubacterium sp.]